MNAAITIATSSGACINKGTSTRGVVALTAPEDSGHTFRRLSPALRVAGVEVKELGRSGDQGGYRYGIRRLSDHVQDVQ